MNSISKFWQTEDTLKQMVVKATGEQLHSFIAKPLDGGFCNAVYLIVANDKEMVLKIAPQEHIKMMSDEYNLLLNEAQMLDSIKQNISLK